MSNTTGQEPKTIAIVQARMSSARLPRKVLRPLVGKPVIWHVVHRLKRCSTLSKIVIATSTDPSDDPLADYVERMGVSCVRGPLDNVLERFRLAIEAHPCDAVVRVTGDCPLIDPGFVDHIVRAMIDDDGDYVDVPDPDHSIHEGMDPVSVRAFRRLWTEVPDDPVAQEHTSSYLKVHPDFARCTMTDCRADHRVSQPVRISVDTPADLTFIETLYDLLGAAPGDLDLADVVRLLNDRPDLRRINAHVRQRDARHTGHTVFIRFEGSNLVSARSLPAYLALGSAFRDRLAWGVTFIAEGDAAQQLEDRHFRVLRPSPTETAAWFTDLVHSETPDVLVVGDVIARIPAALDAWRSLGPNVSLFSWNTCIDPAVDALAAAARIADEAGVPATQQAST